MLRDRQIGSGEHCSWTVCQSSWTLITKPPFCTFWWTLFVNSLPKFVNIVQQTPFLLFLVNIVREQFAKVREQCSPNLPFALSGEHCSWTFCQSSWTLFTKPPYCSLWWTMFVNNLPKFVNSVQQTPFLLFPVNIVREQFAKDREQCSPNPLFRPFWRSCSWTVCQFVNMITTN